MSRGIPRTPGNSSAISTWISPSTGSSVGSMARTRRGADLWRRSRPASPRTWCLPVGGALSSGGPFLRRLARLRDGQAACLARKAGRTAGDPRYAAHDGVRGGPDRGDLGLHGEFAVVPARRHPIHPPASALVQGFAQVCAAARRLRLGGDPMPRRRGSARHRPGTGPLAAGDREESPCSADDVRVPRVYPGRLTLFRARVRPLSGPFSDDLGWRAGPAAGSRSGRCPALIEGCWSRLSRDNWPRPSRRHSTGPGACEEGTGSVAGLCESGGLAYGSATLRSHPSLHPRRSAVCDASPAVSATVPARKKDSPAPIDRPSRIRSRCDSLDFSEILYGATDSLHSLRGTINRGLSDVNESRQDRGRGPPSRGALDVRDADGPQRRPAPRPVRARPGQRAAAESAFRRLVHRHGPMVMGVCRQILRRPQDADDAFQATFLILVRKARSIRVVDSLAPWLYGVAYRTANRAEQSVASRYRSADVETMEEPMGPSPDDAFDFDLRPLLHEELSRLPGKYRDPSSSATWKVSRTRRPPGCCNGPSARSAAGSRAAGRSSSRGSNAAAWRSRP